MKIVNIIGGLGNQMFQYSFALSLKAKNPNDDILIDTSHFNYLFLKKIRTANLHNGFEIKKIFLNADLKIASPGQIKKVTRYIPNYLLSRIIRRILPHKKSEIIQAPSKYFSYTESVYKHTGDFYYEGYWQSIKYYLPIKNLLLKTYRHPCPNHINSNYIEEIKNTNSVGIHVRRGDYISSKLFKGICSIDYYREAIRELNKGKKIYSFFIFSDDIEWCTKNLLPLLDGNNVLFVTENTGENSFWDMVLMTYCKNLIIANSSFSWWAAFLNTTKGKIIVPKTWCNSSFEIDLYDPSWIKI